jgi:hypothetical protein
MTGPRRALAVLSLVVFGLRPVPVLAQAVAPPGPVVLAPGPFANPPAPSPGLEQPPSIDLSEGTSDTAAADGADAPSAPTGAGPAANPPDPATETADAVALLDSPPRPDNVASPDTSNTGPGLSSQPGPLIAPPPGVTADCRTEYSGHHLRVARLAPIFQRNHREAERTEC